MLDIAFLDSDDPLEQRVSCDLFDSETGLWTRLPEMVVERLYYPSIMAIQRGAGHRIYIFGGGKHENILDSCEFIDVGESEWTLLEARMATRRHGARAVLLDHTTIVICGGYDGEQELASCDCLDLTTHTFSPFPDMLESRSPHAGLHYNGTIVVLGGQYGPDPSSEQFDPAVFKWTPFPPLEGSCQEDGAAVVDGKIYAIDVNFGVHVYAGAAWTAVTEMPPSRYSYIAASVALGGKLVFVPAYRNDADVFDPDTNSWDLLPKMARDRGEVTAISF